jgi:hypothetical protein
MTPDVARTAAEIFRRRVIAARSLDRGERFLAGPRLFERACVLATAGLRQRHPAASDAAIRTLLRRQLAVLRRLEAAR